MMHLNTWNTWGSLVARVPKAHSYNTETPLDSKWTASYKVTACRFATSSHAVSHPNLPLWWSGVSKVKNYLMILEMIKSWQFCFFLHHCKITIMHWCFRVITNLNDFIFPSTATACFNCYWQYVMSHSICINWYECKLATYKQPQLAASMSCAIRVCLSIHEMRARSKTLFWKLSFLYQLCWPTRSTVALEIWNIDI